MTEQRPTFFISGVTMKNALETAVVNEGLGLDMQQVTILGTPTGIALRNGGTLRAEDCKFDPARPEEDA